MSYAAAIAFVLEREGGFVNDAADRGGATKYGITHATLARARGVPVSIADVRALRITEAVAIYERDYWRAARCDAIAHPTLALCHFDAAVNHGVGRAVRFLQRAVGATPDGAWGPNTQAAVASCAADDAVAAYLRERARFFRRIVANDATQSKFLRGWLARCRHVARECGVPIDPEYA